MALDVGAGRSAPRQLARAPHARHGRRYLRAVADVAAVRVPRELDRLDPVLLVAGLRAHRLAPLAHVVLRRAGHSLAADLAPTYHQAVLGHLRTRALLPEVERLLGNSRWVVLKGPVLSEHAHPVPSVRPYADVDLLVDPRDLGATMERLLGAGWVLLDGATTLAERPGELHLRTPGQVLVDLHWSLVRTASDRELFPVSTAALLDRRVVRLLGARTVPSLGDVDLLLHVCLHAALAGADRVLLLLDADQLVRRTVDWDTVVDRARAWGAGPSVAMVLERARQVLDTPVPREALAGLAPALVRRVGGIRPCAWPDPTRASLTRLALRSARSGVGPSVRQAARQGTLRLRPSQREPPGAAGTPPAALDDYVEAVGAEVGRRRSVST